MCDNSVEPPEMQLIHAAIQAVWRFRPRKKCPALENAIFSVIAWGRVSFSKLCHGLQKSQKTADIIFAGLGEPVSPVGPLFAQHGASSQCFQQLRSIGKGGFGLLESHPHAGSLAHLGPFVFEALDNGLVPMVLGLDGAV